MIQSIVFKNKSILALRGDNMRQSEKVTIVARPQLFIVMLAYRKKGQSLFR
jgi:hypothetical protein